MPFRFSRLEIPGLVLVEVKKMADERGQFMETFKRSVFAEAGISETFVQDNVSYSRRGVLRGLHYQLNPHAQGKLVRVVLGAVFDVAVDIRHGSPTYGKWVGCTLSDENMNMLYLPPGFAHGVCVLSPEAYLSYKVTDEYAPECERGILWNDPDIDIRWPVDEPLLSSRDATFPRLREADNNFEYA